jgi:LacI family transcriptional regulator
MNIEEVARKARVSTATVSRVINGLSSVKPLKAERVRLAIAELGFHPNINARALDDPAYSDSSSLTSPILFFQS